MHIISIHCYLSHCQHSQLPAHHHFWMVWGLSSGSAFSLRFILHPPSPYGSFYILPFPVNIVNGFIGILFYIFPSPLPPAPPKDLKHK